MMDHDSDSDSDHSGVELSEQDEESVEEHDEHEHRVQQQSRKRALQHVSTKRAKIQVVKWMVETQDREGMKNLPSKTVKQFPMHFRSSIKANLGKATDWWKKRDDILRAERRGQNPRVVVSRQTNLKRVLQRKAATGRGRKQALWVQWLHNELQDEFNRLRKAGLQISAQVLIAMAKDILRNSEGQFNAQYVDPKSRQLIIEKIDYSWIQHFMAKKNIVYRKQTGKLSVSPAKLEFIEKTVAFHLGQIKREFAAGTLQEDMIENVDETHFLINMDNGRTLGFAGDEKVKYADVVSGSEGITMIIRITGGKNAYIEPPFLVFKNANRSYPVRGVPDNVPGVSYRTSPKAFVDCQLFAEYFRENHAHHRDGRSDRGRERVIFLDNFSGHNNTEELQQALEGLKATLRFFPSNATDLIQPADSFVISKIKDYWREQWNLKKIELIRENHWQDRVRRDGTWSGKLQQPGKQFFLRLAADSVRAVNAQRDANRLTYARKAMIRTGLSLDVDGVWRVEQLYPELQQIVEKYHEEFNGKVVDELDEVHEHAEDEEVI